MKSIPALRRWVSLLMTASVFAAVVGFAVLRGPSDNSAKADASDKEAARSWPLFGGSLQRNLVNTAEKNIPTTWDPEAGQEKNIKWSVPLGTLAYGGPVIAGGKIFIGTNNERPRDPAIKGDKGILMCFRESDGKFLWQAVHDKLPAGRVNDWPREGICSSPFVQGNRLYYVSNRCEVVCADTEGSGDGKAKFVWKLDMIKKLGVFPHNLATCSPLAVGDMLFVITSNGVDEEHINVPAPNAPSFLALSKKDGEVIWQSNAPGKKIMHGQWSNPVYAEPKGKPMIIFPGGDGYIRAFNPKTGDLLWKFDCNPKNSVYTLGPDGTKNDFVSTPVIWENKLYIGVGQDPEHKKAVGHLWCIDITKEPKNKDKDLSPVNDNFDPKAKVNKDSGLVWHYGGKDREGGYYFGRTLSTCAVHDGLCYAADFDGKVYCFDANTGEKYWDHEMNSDTWCSPYWVGGHVYIGNEDGVVHVFKHGKTKDLVGTIDMGGKVRATPVAVNDVLYMITENPCKLWAIAKK